MMTHPACQLTSATKRVGGLLPGRQQPVIGYAFLWCRATVSICPPGNAKGCARAGPSSGAASDESRREGCRRSAAVARGAALLDTSACGWTVLFLDGRFQQVRPSGKSVLPGREHRQCMVRIRFNALYSRLMSQQYQRHAHSTRGDMKKIVRRTALKSPELRHQLEHWHIPAPHVLRLAAAPCIHGANLHALSPTTTSVHTHLPDRPKRICSISAL